MRKLTSEQNASIESRKGVWGEKIFSPQPPFSEEDLVAAVTKIYARITEPQPEIVFVDSPAQAVQELLRLKILSDLETDYKPEEYLGIDKRLLYWSIDILAEQLDLNDLEKTRQSTWVQIDQRSRLLSSIFDGIISQVVNDAVQHAGNKYSDRDVKYIVTNTIQNNRLDRNALGWLSYIEAFQIAGTDFGYLDALQDIVDRAGMAWMFGEKVVICRQPVSCFDDRNRFHNESGPALSYADGSNWYFWHGVEVPKYVVMHPEQISTEDITKEPNAEVRRVKLDRFGIENFIQKCDAEKLHVDDWGILWRARMREDEDLVMVQVVNSTPEPDGTFKDYFLRVPPQTTTARQGVAWTFGFEREKDYNPIVQS